jgi:hypothetical protein
MTDFYLSCFVLFDGLFVFQTATSPTTHSRHAMAPRNVSVQSVCTQLPVIQSDLNLPPTLHSCANQHDAYGHKQPTDTYGHKQPTDTYSARYTRPIIANHTRSNKWHHCNAFIVRCNIVIRRSFNDQLGRTSGRSGTAMRGHCSGGGFDFGDSTPQTEKQVCMSMKKCHIHPV